MGEGPTLTTTRLRALPVTVWNAGFVAEELAGSIGLARPPQPAGPWGGLFGGAVDAGGVGPISDDLDGAGPVAADPAAMRRELRRRTGGGTGIMTWVLRARDGAALGLLAADAQGNRAAVAVSICVGYRRDRFATEAVRALVGWLEYRGVLVGTRIRIGDTVGKRLAQTTAFVPTGILLAGRRRLWVRPPT